MNPVALSSEPMLFLLRKMPVLAADCPRVVGQSTIARVTASVEMFCVLSVCSMSLLLWPRQMDCGWTTRVPWLRMCWWFVPQLILRM